MIIYPSMFNRSWLILIAVIMVFGSSCSSGSGENKGSNIESSVTNTIGPIKNLVINEGIDHVLAQEGEGIFDSKCAACHKFEERYVGPALAGLTERRDPVWIMNMIIAPEEMTQHDPVAGQLLAEYMTQMANQNISEGDARALLEFFRSIDNNSNSNL